MPIAGRCRIATISILLRTMTNSLTIPVCFRFPVSVHVCGHVHDFVCVHLPSPCPFPNLLTCLSAARNEKLGIGILLKGFQAGANYKQIMPTFFYITKPNVAYKMAAEYNFVCNVSPGIDPGC